MLELMLKTIVWPIFWLLGQMWCKFYVVGPALNLVSDLLDLNHLSFSAPVYCHTYIVKFERALSICI